MAITVQYLIRIGMVAEGNLNENETFICSKYGSFLNRYIQIGIKAVT